MKEAQQKPLSAHVRTTKIGHRLYVNYGMAPNST